MKEKSITLFILKFHSAFCISDIDSGDDESADDDNGNAASVLYAIPHITCYPLLQIHAISYFTCHVPLASQK